jgi:arylsulfatase A-like enzyme
MSCWKRAVRRPDPSDDLGETGFTMLMRFFLITIAVFCASASHAADAQRPNIVFILADDLGYTDLACYGSKYYETPNIDRLAAEGVRFTDGYTCGANCQPTRAALISGQYGPRTGVYTVGNIDRFNWRSRPLRPVNNVTSLPLEKVTIADALQKAGYATGMFGKWHLGKGDHHPAKRGFDEAIESSGVHFNFKTDPVVEYPQGQYLADFLTDRAVDFITRHKDEPFFLYLPHFGVHAPHQAKPELVERFKSKPAVGGHENPAYAAMIASVDESVGRVLATLDELGLDDNTLVIFSSDNGGVGSYKSVGLPKSGITNNRPLKGGKGTFYEGGIRVPYIFRWPGVAEAGQTNSSPIISVDLYPTLLEVSGAQRPADYPLDGVSYASLLKGQSDSLDREAIYWHFPGYLGQGAGAWRTKPVSVVRAGDWKLRENLEDGKLELYNLQEDLSEMQDLAAAEPETAKRLHETLLAWRKQVGAKLPTANTAAEDGGQRPRNRENRQRRRARRAA